jgi:hypothetical protein
MRQTSENFGGKRRRAADIAALKLEEFTFSISRLSTSILTCMKMLKLP